MPDHTEFISNERVFEEKIEVKQERTEVNFKRKKNLFC